AASRDKTQVEVLVGSLPVGALRIVHVRRNARRAGESIAREDDAFLPVTIAEADREAKGPLLDPAADREKLLELTRTRLCDPETALLQPLHEPISRQQTKS